MPQICALLPEATWSRAVARAFLSVLGILALACCRPFLMVNGDCVCALRIPYTHPFGNLFYEIFISMFSNVRVLRNNKQHREYIATQMVQGLQEGGEQCYFKYCRMVYNPEGGGVGEEGGRADGHSVHLRWSGTVIGQQQRDFYLEALSSPRFSPGFTHTSVPANVALRFMGFSSWALPW